MYERSRSTECLEQNAKSPHTNEPMGKKLLPATQVKNLIWRSMVRSGAISGDKAGAWTKKLEGEKEVEEMRQKAEALDAEAMMSLADWYQDGTNGLQKSPSATSGRSARPTSITRKASRRWAGVPISAKGPSKQPLGNVLCAQAATMGLDHACYLMADRYAHEGEDTGLPKDLERAQYWAKKDADEGHVKHRCMTDTPRQGRSLGGRELRIRSPPSAYAAAACG